VDNRNSLEDREHLPPQSNLGSLSCNREWQEDARIVASVRQLLDVRIGRFHACRAQQEAFTMRFSERTVDQTSSVDASVGSSMTHPFFVSLYDLTPDREYVLCAHAVTE